MLDKMYKVAVVLDNSSNQELFTNKFPYLKKAVLSEEALIKLEHYGKFPTLKEFYHSLLEISKFCVKNKIKGMIMACDYDYSDDEYIWQNYVDIKHFRKTNTFSAIINRDRNLNKLIKHMNSDDYLKGLFGGDLKRTYFDSNSERSVFFEEKEVSAYTSVKNGTLWVSYHYHNIHIEFTLKTSGKENNIRIEKSLKLTNNLKIKDYKTLKLAIMRMLQIVDDEVSNLKIKQ